MRSIKKILPRKKTCGKQMLAASACVSQLHAKENAVYALSFLRPFARLRFKTLRPSAVFMRLRKPCTLLRCRFFG